MIIQFAKNTWLLLAILGLTLSFSSCDKDDDDDSDSNTITAIAAASDDFSILVDALTRTGLDEVLDEPGSYTVFAPNNTAFENLLDQNGLADLDALESAVTTQGLKDILLYHVLGAEVKSPAVTTGFVNTLSTYSNTTDGYLSAFINTDGVLLINDVANIINVDIDASNGVIHEIDAVLLQLDIVDLAILSPDHTSLVGALIAADGNLVEALDEPGPFTVFAPVDAAFAEIADVTATLSTSQLTTVLTYHVVSGNVRSTQVPNGEVAALNEQLLDLNTANGVTVTDVSGGTATVVAADIQGTNGVIHAINKVLIPSL